MLGRTRQYSLLRAAGIAIKQRRMHSVLCRFCAAPLANPVLDLGQQPAANAYLNHISDPAPPVWPLRLRWCSACALLQTDETPAAQAIFTDDYVYFSSYSSSWVEHARQFVTHAVEALQLSAQSLVVEVASNDGYLLQHVQAQNIRCYGIEPTLSTANAARAKGIATHTCFLGADTAQQLTAQHGTAQLVVANNVLAHVPNLNDFVAGLACLLAPNGTLCIEFPHVLAMLADTQFDTVYHEHYAYFSLLSAQNVLQKHGLRVYHVQQLPTHGGSLRLWVCFNDAAMATQPSVGAQQQREQAAQLHTLTPYAQLAQRTQAICHELTQFVRSQRAQGKTVAAYGAAAKGVTLVNACGLTANDIVCVADQNPHKQGKIWPLSNIAIVSPAQLRAQQPDYVLLFARNLLHEVQQQWPTLGAGQLVTAIPHLCIMG